MLEDPEAVVKVELEAHGMTQVDRTARRFVDCFEAERSKRVAAAVDIGAGHHEVEILQASSADVGPEPIEVVDALEEDRPLAGRVEGVLHAGRDRHDRAVAKAIHPPCVRRRGANPLRHEIGIGAAVEHPSQGRQHPIGIGQEAKTIERRCIERGEATAERCGIGLLATDEFGEEQAKQLIDAGLRHGRVAERADGDTPRPR